MSLGELILSRLAGGRSICGELRSAGLNEKYVAAVEANILTYIVEDDRLARHIDMIISMAEHQQNEEEEEDGD
jgi:hypothetical protein